MPRGYPDWGRVAGGIPGTSEMPTYSTFAATTLTATNTAYPISLFNPAASAYVVFIRRIHLVLTLNGDTSLAQPEIILHFTSSLGTGTLTVPVRHLSTDPEATAQARRSLSAAAVSTSHIIEQVLYRADRRLLNPFYTGDLSSEHLLYEHREGDRGRPITLPAGEGIMLQVFPHILDGFASVRVEHVEALAGE